MNNSNNYPVTLAVTLDEAVNQRPKTNCQVGLLF